MSEKREPIYERIAPGEVFILFKDKEGLTYIGNKDGHAFISKVYFKDTVEVKI